MRIGAWSIVGGIMALSCLFGFAGGCDGDSGETAAACAPGLESCDGACVDLANDSEHCGSCALVCGGGLACIDGECGNACADGESICDGGCVDTTSDASHCGGCGNACADGSVCDAGACASSCSAPTTRCGDSCVDTATDDAHCGGCNMACGAAESCVAGACTTANPCGNGSLDGGEECDDGNTTAGDGCDEGCVVECNGQNTFKDPATFHCYLLVEAVQTWDNARAECQKRGAGWDLIGLVDDAERNFMDDVIAAPDNCWVGGNDIASKGNWVWANGEPWSDAFWVAGEPNGSGDCARTLAWGGQSNDELRDTNCDISYPYVCELTPAGS